MTEQNPTDDTGIEPSSQSLAARVLSYNVGNGLAPAERLVHYLYYAEADIIGLQELSNDQADAIEKYLSVAFPYRVLAPGGFEGKGLLSKFPILSSESVAFATGRPDLRAQLEVAGRAAQVVVAHPRPPKVRMSGATFDPVTLRQIQEVAHIAKSERPSLVLGDFNMTDRQPEHRILTSAGLIDAFHEVGTSAASFPRRVGNPHRFGARAQNISLPPVIRIDYIWYTREFVARSASIGGDAGSDHLPVVAALDWRELEPDEGS
ncbi:MAG: endonuclease/exonuclease/phosphatase family protein [Thermomicrobiales bacterium]|nr:endonuclease/exonuclease/phosphatase family protein [Thermomicrobiales bacterium]